MSRPQYIRFDWAAKNILRNKADFVVFEGFISVLVKEKVTIVELLESESNKNTKDDKYNRVDIKAKNSKGEIILVEIQQTRELDYLQRMLYGVARAITEHMKTGVNYEQVKRCSASTSSTSSWVRVLTISIMARPSSTVSTTATNSP